MGEWENCAWLIRSFRVTTIPAGSLRGEDARWFAKVSRKFLSNESGIGSDASFSEIHLYRLTMIHVSKCESECCYYKIEEKV